MTGVLREFPFCARVIDLPCNVGGTDELHCAAGEIHADNVNVLIPGSKTQMDMAAELCSSLTSAATGVACSRGPAPCCNGAPVDTSWGDCRKNGVRPLSQPPFSGFAVPPGPATILGSGDFDYKCPLDSPSPPARYRNRLLPFDCATAYAENCPADDVSIEFTIVEGPFTYREPAVSCP
jgi:hypothetical protein